MEPSALPRPPPWEERLADRMLRVFAPKVPRIRQPDPPDALAPWRHVMARRADGGRVSCTYYPHDAPRGAVLLAPPWMEWGRSYFHRRGRIEALREAGYAALAFDMGGFGDTSPTRGFRDVDAEAALRELRSLVPGVPLHAWGVSSGGHWLHPLLTRVDDVRGAVFEDVTPHLLEWSALVTPRLRGVYRAARRMFPRSDRYMDMRNHAPHMRIAASAYVYGGRDVGIPVESGRALAALAGGECLVVPDADHLEAIKRAPREVIGLALRTFEKAV